MAEQMNRYQRETAKIQGQRYTEVGTPGEIGARARGRDVQSAASYLASLPTGDKYLRETTGQANRFEPAKEAAQADLSEAQRQYAEALRKTSERPEPTIDETPSWARSTVT